MGYIYKIVNDINDKVLNIVLNNICMMRNDQNAMKNVLYIEQ